MNPARASGYSLFGDAKFHIMGENDVTAFFRGDFRVVETDYSRYAIVYGCYKVELTCHILCTLFVSNVAFMLCTSVLLVSNERTGRVTATINWCTY